MSPWVNRIADAGTDPPSVTFGSTGNETVCRPKVAGHILTEEIHVSGIIYLVGLVVVVLFVLSLLGLR